MSTLVNIQLFGQTETDTIYTYEVSEEEDVYYDEAGKVNFIDFGLQSGIPQAAFKQNRTAMLGGFYIDYSRQFRSESPLFIGGSIAYLYMDGFSAEVEREFDGFVEIWDGSTTSSLINFNAGAKYFLDLQFWRIEPYLEGSIGANWFFTNTSFSFPDSDESDNNFEGGEIVLSYGGGVGLMFYLTDNYYLNLSGGYYPGLSAKYFLEKAEKPAVLSTTIQGFEHKKSTTDMLRLKLGFTIAF